MTSTIKQITISVHGHTAALRFPALIADTIEGLFPNYSSASTAPHRIITVQQLETRKFSILDGVHVRATELDRHDLPMFVMDAVIRALIEDLSPAVALHAGAVLWQGRSVLIAGPSGAGKSTLVAWLAAHGFGYLSDEVVFVLNDEGEILGAPRALLLKPGSAGKIGALEIFRNSTTPLANGNLLLRPPSAPDSSGASVCGLILFPRFDPAARAASITPIGAAKAGLHLMQCNVSARKMTDGGLGTTAALARKAPAAVLRFGAVEHLNGVADIAARLVLDEAPDRARGMGAISAFSERLQAAAPSTPAPPIRRAPAKRTAKKLSIGMATYDDYDGVYFSLQALRLYHPEILEDVEFIVIDNHPDGPCAQALRDLEQKFQNYYYIPQNGKQGTSTRQFIFEEAIGELVLCIDSHVFIASGAVKRLLDYFDANPDTKDLLQGPLLSDSLATVSTHFDTGWRKGMWGYWECDERGKDPEAPPFEIPMQGLGLFACRRTVWPGFNARFRGFGGEEGYIHEKFRQNGGRTLCLPFLRWIHRFSRPMGTPYRNAWDDRIRNYIIGFRELGMQTTEVEEHFRSLLGEDEANSIFQSIDNELIFDDDLISG